MFIYIIGWICFALMLARIIFDILSLKKKGDYFHVYRKPKE